MNVKITVIAYTGSWIYNKVIDYEQDITIQDKHYRIMDVMANVSFWPIDKTIIECEIIDEEDKNENL